MLGIGAGWLTRGAGGEQDPSPRLKNGCVQDDSEALSSRPKQYRVLGGSDRKILQGKGIRYVRVVALLAIGLALGGCKSKSAASASTMTAAAQPQLSTRSEEFSRRSEAPRLMCPPIDSSSVPSPSVLSPSTNHGGHRVVLSWKASPRDSKHGVAAGYCLYRSATPGKGPSEQVNVVPFAGTKCVDDLVENGKKYYYVVRAISAQGTTSVVSKPAPAVIPDSPPAASLVKVSAPACRLPGLK
jgi:hypothetical protein